jgi:hypothetical protein
MDKEALLKQIELVRGDMTRQIEGETRLYKDSLRDALRQVAASQEAAKMKLEEHAGDVWGAHALMTMMVGPKEAAGIYSAVAIESYLNVGSGQCQGKIGLELGQLARACSGIEYKCDSKNHKVFLDTVSKVLQRLEDAGLGEHYSKPIEVIKAFLASVQRDNQSQGQSSDSVGQGGHE